MGLDVLALLFKQSSKIARGTLASHLIQMLGLLGLMSLYPPEVIAKWAIWSATAIILSNFSSLRYETSLMLPKDEADANILLSATFLLIIFSTSIMTGLLLAGNSLIYHFIEIDRALFVGATVVYYLSYGLFAVSHVWLSRRQDFSTLGNAILIQSLTSVVIQLLGSILLAPSIATLVLGTVAGLIAAVLFVAPRVMRSFSMQEVRGQDMLRALLKYRVYPTTVLPRYLLVAVMERGALFVISFISGVQVVGLYTMAKRFADAPAGLIGNSIRPVFYEFAQRAERPAIVQFVYKTWLGLGVPLVILCIAPLITFQEFGLLLSEQWRASFGYFQVMLIPMLITLLTGWMDRLFDVLFLQKQALMYEIIVGCASLASFVVAKRSLNLSDFEAIAIMCAIGAISQSVRTSYLLTQLDASLKESNRAAIAVALTFGGSWALATILKLIFDNAMMTWTIYSLFATVTSIIILKKVIRNRITYERTGEPTLHRDSA